MGSSHRAAQDAAKRKRFTAEQKQAAVKDLVGGMTLKEASEKHKVSMNSLAKWKAGETGVKRRRRRRQANGNDVEVLEAALKALDDLRGVIKRMAKAREQLKKML